MQKIRNKYFTKYNIKGILGVLCTGGSVAEWLERRI